jgi:hypothetical protein
MTVRIVPDGDADEALWRTTLEVADLLGELPWVLIGAQMIRLLELEHGRRSGRSTVDVDVIVDVRVLVDVTRSAANRLHAAGFELSAEHPYRFVRGRDQVDVLAPDGLGARADLTTIPPLSTTGIPGGTRALETRRMVRVEVVGVGAREIPVPTLAGALVAKLRAHAARREQRDLADLVRLLGLVDDLDEVRSHLRPRERRDLGSIASLRDASNAVWSAAADPDEARAAFARLSD